MEKRENLINQLAQEMKIGIKHEEKDEHQYISATGTLETDPEKSLEKLRPVEKKEEDPWSRLKLNPTDFR